MDVKRQCGLYFPEEYLVACVLNHLQQAEVLQYFVNRISFYAFVGGEAEPSALLATRVVADCRQALAPEVTAVADPDIREAFIRYISEFSALSSNQELSAEEKHRNGFYMMERWERETAQLLKYPRTFYLNDNQFVILPFEFSLLCSVTGLTTAQLLQYFLSNISMAAQRAVNLVEGGQTNSAMAVFGTLVMSRSMKGMMATVQAERYQGYASQLLALDDQLSSEPDFEKRKAAYSVFYLKWYRDLSGIKSR